MFCASRSSVRSSRIVDKLLCPDGMYSPGYIGNSRMVKELPSLSSDIEW